MIRLALAALALCLVSLAYWPESRAGEACDIVGKASYYCCKHHGRITASGERFNQNAMTAAMVDSKHIGERWRVTYKGKSVIVRINDTGGFEKYGRVIDLSKGAAAKIGMVQAGVGKVCMVRL